MTERAVQQRSCNRARAEDHDLRRVGILRSETKRRRVLVVNLVDVLVEGAPVKCLVGYSERMRTGYTSRPGKARTEEVEHVLEDEEGRDLRSHNLP